MFLTRLSLTDFRSFSRLDIEIPRRVVLLVGDNAQGKTSVLESVFYLATFNSFNTTVDKQLINFNNPSTPLSLARIVADYERHGRNHTLEVRLIQESNGANSYNRFRKEILLDGVKKRQSEIYGHFNAVIFLPQMARIIENGPSERRRFIDMLLSQVIQGYAKQLSDYEKILTQRNALLKILAEKGGDTHQLETWDDMLAKHGASIMFSRIQLLKDLDFIARKIHQQLTRDSEILQLVYLPSFEPLPNQKSQLSFPVLTVVDRTKLSESDIKIAFQKALHEKYREDIARGITTLGPHRDELRFMSNRIDLGDYGSRGQIRTALLSLKLAEVEWMKGKTGEWPVLLLDETMSELDNQRRSDLLQALESSEQALLTSTDLNMFPGEFIDHHKVWYVRNGIISDK